ncbi:MAG: solute-binding protein [Nitrospinaceae bacterium]|jgi:tungstate transport system substrate-binding protein|nr:solute-binding protein [Nitrospinaceae bacterium]MBT3434179.1 solute-binding protein [Nitrospinaceae bacterium]MBT3821010.1 solute-binding protein [Nitrospinaceae bacterium]MBT4432100.1 solute-binding protein [Nitrospinaceae bacterium]MBT5369494.1 solute-binding protein [Nitrospinaceae bacterium]
MLGRWRTIVSAVVVAFFLATPAHAAKTLRLATTTSTHFTGLLDWLHPHFEKRHNVRIHTIAVGTGKALRLGQNGDVDVVLVHAPAAELKFVNEGHGVNRRGVMHNDFVIVGPGADPAGVSGAKSAASALRRIRGKKSLWLSRGDDSGTYKKEIFLWQFAGVKPEGKWYRSLGQGMGATLRAADEMRAYTLSDRGSFLFMAARGKVALKVLFEGAISLLNPYGVIAVNPERHPYIKFDLAMKYVRFLTSKEGQRLIDKFRLKGKKLFYPSAVKRQAGS